MASQIPAPRHPIPAFKSVPYRNFTSARIVRNGLMVGGIIEPLRVHERSRLSLPIINVSDRNLLFQVGAGRGIGIGE